jgi:hypothetical protein
MTGATMAPQATAVSGDILPIAPSGEFVDEKLTVP